MSISNSVPTGMNGPKMQARMDEAIRKLIGVLDKDCNTYPRDMYDMSDLGNTVGLTVAKYFRSDLPGSYDKKAFLSGLYPMSSAPHNKKRYGEEWPADRIKTTLKEIYPFQDVFILSGGWAWHFMSPVGHKELKHAHDHKDVDVFVYPSDVGTTVIRLKNAGFERVFTKYNRVKSSEDFRRYEKVVGKMRVTIYFFVARVPYIMANGWKVVEPRTLLSFYGTIHLSDKCFAVQAATKLLEKGVNPVGRKELVEIPT